MIPKRYLLVLGTFFLSVLLYMDRVCISVSEEPISTTLSLSEKQFGWVVSAFALGYALFQAPGGWFCDRLGPRRVLTAVVTFWSIFTGLTAAAFSWVSLLAARFFFGAGEAGAFPGMARAAFSWIPMAERGIVQGINFSGSRLGAAFALPAVAWSIDEFGWRWTFAGLMVIGFGWAVFWWVWFRDDPTQHPRIRREELDHILSKRQPASDGGREEPLTASLLARSRNMWLVAGQYFCSNFTFFFCITWLYPHIKETYHLQSVEAGWYASAPLICGALGNWFAGWLVDSIYRKDHWILSRRLPAVAGYALAAVGLVVSVTMETPGGAILWLSVAIFGADMTLPPSWSVSIDIGRSHAGVVSGTMNMAGNIGSFVTGLAFPYLAAWTGSYDPFFFVAAGLNILAIFLWLKIKPQKKLEEY